MIKHCKIIKQNTPFPYNVQIWHKIASEWVYAGAGKMFKTYEEAVKYAKQNGESFNYENGIGVVGEMTGYLLGFWYSHNTKNGNSVYEVVFYNEEGHIQKSTAKGYTLENCSGVRYELFDKENPKYFVDYHISASGRYIIDKCYKGEE